MNHLDLFSGIGGFALAMSSVGIKTSAFCEIDPYCQKVLVKNFPGARVYGDVRALTRKQLERDEINAEIITAGFPCQPFSTSGERRGSEDDRNLWPEAMRLVRECRPRWFIGENVFGIVDMELDTVLSDLEDAGYAGRAFIVPACAVDSPHRRDRVWIVAHSDGVRLPRQRGRIQPIDQAEDAYRQANRFVNAVQGDALPFVCRGHDGVSRGVDENRLRALGNAIVPQVASYLAAGIVALEIRASVEAGDPPEYAREEFA